MRTSLAIVLWSEYLQTTMKKCFLFFLVLIPAVLQAQVDFNKRQTKIYWPFGDSYYLGGKSATTGWGLICGSGCGFHLDGDLNAQDWTISGCSREGGYCGEPVYAPFAGTVMLTRHSNEGYGNQLILQSLEDSTFAMRMAHFQLLFVNLYDTVAAGQQIALMGDTGNGGCHVHFALYKGLYDTTVYQGVSMLFRDYLLQRTMYRPLPAELSTPFAFTATNDRLFWSPDIPQKGQPYFIEEIDSIIGDLTNMSEIYGRTVDLSYVDELLLEDGQTKTLGGGIQRVAIAANTTQRVSLPPISDKPGLHQLTFLFQLDGGASECKSDEFLKTTLRVVSKEECKNQFEPNHTPETAHEVTTLGLEQEAVPIASFLSDSDSLDIDFYRLPTQASGTMQIEPFQTEQPGTSYFLWNGDSIPTSEFKTPQVIRQHDVLYFVVVANSDTPNCAFYKYTLNWDPNTEVQVFPNPSASTVSVQVPDQRGIYRIEVFNTHGQQVFFQAGIEPNFDNQILLEHQLPSGWYHMLVWQGSTLMSRIPWVVNK